MTRLELVYPKPAPANDEPLEYALAEVDRPHVCGITVTPTTRVRSWNMPNRRLARMVRRRLLEAFKTHGEPEPGVSLLTVSRR